MNKIIPVSFILIFILTLPSFGNEIFVPKASQMPQDSLLNTNAEQLIKFDRKELAEKTSRILTFKERVAIKIVKKKFRKNSKRRLVQNPKNLAIAGFTISTITLMSTLIGFLTFSPFFIFIGIFCLLGALVSKTALDRIEWEDEHQRGKGFAKAGIWLAVLTIILFLILGNALL